MPVDRHGRSGSFLLPGTSTDPWGQLLWPVTVAGVPAIEIHCMADVVSIRKAWRKKWKSIKQTTIKRMKQTKGTRAHVLILDTSIYNWEQICYRSSLVYPHQKKTNTSWQNSLNHRTEPAGQVPHGCPSLDGFSIFCTRITCTDCASRLKPKPRFLSPSPSDITYIMLTKD